MQQNNNISMLQLCKFHKQVCNCVKPHKIYVGPNDYSY